MAAITQFQASDRPWQMPLTAALATGLPLLIAAWTGLGLLSSLGGMAFSLPARHAHAPSHGHHHGLQLRPDRQFHAGPLQPVAAAGGGTGADRHHHSGDDDLPLLPPATAGQLLLRDAGRPGRLYPGAVLEIPLRVGLLAMGSLLACVLAFGYSLHVLRWRTPKPVQPLPAPDFDFVVMDALIIGLTVGLSLLLAEWLQLQRPYWVPVSCLAVLQGPACARCGTASSSACWGRHWGCC
jgi:hypothetical protein